MFGFAWFLVLIAILLLFGIGWVLYRAKPIALSLLLDTWDMILSRFGGKPPIQSLKMADELDSFVAQQTAAYRVPGVAAGVVTPGKVGWRNGYGRANLTDGAAVTTETAFGLGSISKTFIGVALMQAIEDGVLALDTEINSVLPFTVTNPRVDGGPITMRHLATHTSGIKDHLWTYSVQSYTAGDPQTELGQFLQAYLVPGGRHYNERGNFVEAEPGIEYHYSNIASALAAYVIEVATGQPFEQFTHERIFQPLQMNNTAWFLRDLPQESTVAMPYNRAGRPYGYLGIASWPDGQLRSSVSDLSRYLAAVMNEGELEGVRILRKESVRMMLSPPLPTLEIEDEGEEQYVFWGSENGMIGHNGGDPGVFTLMFFNPETKRGGIVLTNSLTRRSTQCATAILRQLLRYPQAN